MNPNEKEGSFSADTLVASYDYFLPPELIAQRPVEKDRSHSRLLVYEVATQKVTHDYFYNLKKYLPHDSTLVFNQSKVYPSRLIGKKSSGGKVELFFLGHEADASDCFTVLLKTRSKKSVGDTFVFADDMKVRVEKILEQGLFGVSLQLPQGYSSLMQYLEKNALIPIPPYIRKGESDEQDRQQYQTVYSKDLGSVAAPTAGLHFTPELLSELKKSGIHDAFVTLHVGLGTFRPVSVEDIKDHVMHEESYFIDTDNFAKISAGHSLIAVGTTSLRVLESLHREAVFAPGKTYKTSIFLHPGVEVKSVAGLITNFHLPKSTLLMLVSSLIGREKTLELYSMAVKEKYRFFSYGDAMLVLR